MAAPSASGWRRGIASNLALAAMLAVSASCAVQPLYGSGPADTMYRIDGRDVPLVGGRAESDAAPGSAAKLTTVVLGGPVEGDLDGDGIADAAVLLVHRTGGSGTFLYVAASIHAPGGFRGTDAVPLGDRVAVRDVRIADGRIVVRYADRLAGEPMTAPPSIERTAVLVLTAGRLAIVRNTPEPR